MDRVFIKNLALQALIGVYEFERQAKQQVIVDLELFTDLEKACGSDNVADTLDYGKIAERLKDIALQSSYRLLEALGKEMLDMLANEFAAQKVKLTLHKPDILDNAESVGIILERDYMNGGHTSS